MLVNFNIDPDAIDNSTNEYHVSELRKKWQLSGVLAHPSFDDGSLSLISRKFLQLNQEKQSLWDDAWQEIENNPTRYLRCKDNFKVALVSEARATHRGIPHGGSGYFDGGSLGNVEWIRLKEINASREFQDLDIQAQSGLAAGQTIQEIWEQRLEPLARHSKQVAIVDRYSCSRIIENRLSNRDNSGNGLIQLIGLMADNASLESIAVFSSLNYTPEENTDRISNPERIEIVRTALDDAMHQFADVKLTANFPRSKAFENYAHDRHISFDGYRACAIGIGPEEAFQGATLRRNTQFSYKYGEQMRDLKVAECKLKAATGPGFQFVI